MTAAEIEVAVDVLRVQYRLEYLEVQATPDGPRWAGKRPGRPWVAHLSSVQRVVQALTFDPAAQRDFERDAIAMGM